MSATIRWPLLPRTVFRRPCSIFGSSVPRHVLSYSNSSEARACSRTSDLKISAGEDERRVREGIEQLTGDGGWRVSSSGSGLERTFKFKSFKAAFGYMTQVAQECKEMRHHPEWSNVYDSVFIRWTTHNPVGVSSKDVEAVERCDRIAAQFEVLPLQAEDPNALADLTEEDATFGRECCSKK